MLKEWTVSELKEIVEGLEDFDEYAFYAVRYEEKEREVGEICDNSRHNPDREDERDFPEYDDPGYEDLPELDGTSGWRLYSSYYGSWNTDKDCTYSTFCNHAYIITSDDPGIHENPDYNEILLRNARVVAILK